MNIITRSQWGAQYSAGQGTVRLPVPEVWLHHSVTSPGDGSEASERRIMRELERIGQSRFKAGISYTFAVFPSGRVYEGTGAGRLGTHTGGRNSSAHAIVLVGNYEELEPTDSQLRAVAALLRYGKDQGWWKYARLNGGHRDLKATACPGIKAYRRIPHINDLAASVSPQEQEDWMATNEARDLLLRINHTVEVVLSDRLGAIENRLTAVENVLAAELVNAARDSGSLKAEVDELRRNVRQVITEAGGTPGN